MNETSKNIDYRALMANALVQLETLQQKLDALEHQNKEPIAILGMGCRFPGGVNSPEDFWHLLENGVDAVTKVPKNRWEVDKYYDSTPANPGKIITRDGGFLEEVDTFDAEFFGISPREALSLDPQQRLLLEVSYSALENACLLPEKLFNSLTGVFVGISSNDYAHRLLAADKVDAYFGTGNAFSAAAGRISYVLGLTGPCLALETACSSSLVALHLACQSLRQKECNVALAGGVNLMLSPHISIAFSQAGMLAPDGRCKTFDAAANGYVRGEGCGVVVLKRLGDAIADGDNILAVIRGSAVNQDGPSGGLTVPNGPSQEAVIRKALSNGGVSPEQVSYIEAHGTGTSLGDPIELVALDAVFGKSHSQQQPLTIGSVKTNIGHLEAAAGIAGLIKVVLQLQHKKIAPHLHLQTPNPHVNWSELPLQVPTTVTPWQSEAKTLVAGVSSFSFSGTNAHVVLEQAPIASGGQKSKQQRPKHILTLSAKTQEALEQLVTRYQNHLQANPFQQLADICYTANTGRASAQHRLAAIAESCEELTIKLSQFKLGDLSPGVFQKQLPNSTVVPKIAFLFTGQGSQYVNMGRQLYETQPVFRQALEKCEQILNLDRPLRSLLYPQDEKIQQNQQILDRTAYTQPALFALEYALVQLWQSWGIKPDAVAGHSVGEYVAAHVAGVFSLEDALKLIAARGQLMQQLPPTGEMVAVMAGADLLCDLIGTKSDSVAIAAYNGPASTVLSGATEAIKAICQRLEDKGIKFKKLEVSHAFHSPLMQPMLADFGAIANQVTYNRPKIPLISNLTGQRADETICTPEYWLNHILQPVRFASSIATLAQGGYQTYLEIGPRPILLAMARQCLPEDFGVWLPSIRPGVDDWQQILQSLAHLYVEGAAIDWSGFDRDYDRAKVTLPTYPFERKRYWVEPGKLPLATTSKSNSKSHTHPLLGKRLHLPVSKEIRFESNITKDFPAYLDHHRIYGSVVFLGAGYLEMALAAGISVFKSRNILLEEVNFVNALVLPENSEEKIVHLVLNLETKEIASWQIFSVMPEDADNQNSWILHANGKIICQEQEIPHQVDIEELKAKFNAEESQNFYDKMLDFAYGPLLRNMDRVWQAEGETLSTIKLQQALVSEVSDYVLHPALLDSCFQTMFTLFNKEDVSYEAPYVPIGCKTLRIYSSPPAHLWTHTKLYPSNTQTLTADVHLYSLDGKPIASVLGLQAKKITSKALFSSQQETLANILYEVEWRSKDLVGGNVSPEPKAWLILADKQGIAQQLATQLRSLGDVCTLVFADGQYQQVSPEEFTINPNNPEEFQRLVNQVTQSAQLHGVVQCWSFSDAVGENLSSEELEALSKIGCGTTLFLVQALVRARLSKPPRLWLVTSGAQPVPSDRPVISGIAQSSLWGMGKVIALEHPEFKCVRIDLEPNQKLEAQASDLLAEICSLDKEDQVAFRQGSRYVARLVGSNHSNGDINPPLSFREDSTYLITGGLGDLGLLVARWMVSKGAKNLVLVGRSDPKDSAQSKLRELQEAGATIVLAKADVSKLESIAAVLSNINQSLPPLAGIIHSAGMLEDGSLQQQNWSKFANVMNPKVQGAWHLHELTKNQPLDFFVLFSSIASLLGSPGQGNHSAANAFLDGLAYYRRGIGLPGLSINLGAVSQIGVAAKLQADVLAQKKGITAITPQQVLDALELLISSKAVEVGVVPIKWSAVLPQYDGWAFFSEWRETDLLSGVSQPIFLQQLEAADKSERREILIAHVREQVAQVLGLNPDQSISLEAGFFDLGMDSLTSMELRNRLQASLGCSIPSTGAFDYPTIGEMVNYLIESVLELEFSEGEAGNIKEVNNTNDDLEDLSQDEIASLLAAELNYS